MACIAALDGGGSKTDCLIATLEGECLAWRRTGPSTCFYVPEREAVAAVEEALGGALRDAGVSEPLAAAGLVLPVGVGLALQVFHRAGVPDDRAWSFSEGVACLAAATTDTRGLVVMSGTGSFAATLADGRQLAFAGGMGPLLGDEGSGYAIGLAALRAVAKASDGRRPAPDGSADSAAALTSLVCEHFGVERPRAIVGKVYVPPLPRHRVAELAPLVNEAAEAGDAVARGILRQAAEELAEMARVVLRSALWTEEPFALVPAGGVLTGSRLLREQLCGMVREHARGVELAPLQAPPAVGLAVETIGRLHPDRRLTAREQLLSTFGQLGASTREGQTEAREAAVP